MATTYHVMAQSNRRKPFETHKTTNKQAAEIYVSNARLGGAYDRIWIETTDDSLTPEENAAQRQIEQELAG